MKLAIALTLLTSAYAFSPVNGPSAQQVSTKLQSSIPSDQDTRPRFDPLGLYPKNAPERTAGLIRPLEANESYGTVKDPMNLYTDKSEIDNDVKMSASLPFLKRPEMLDGTLPGDRGFDPFNLSSDKNALAWNRESEIKHARLAMLAAVGWPLAELFGSKSLLGLGDRVPSVLNGGLEKVSPVFWVAILGVVALAEVFSVFKANAAARAGEEYTPGDLGFDPFGLFGKTEKGKIFSLEAELFNGRLAMLAITGFAVQEWLTQDAVINQFPIFFKPINVALEQLADAAGNMM